MRPPLKHTYQSWRHSLREALERCDFLRVGLKGPILVCILSTLADFGLILTQKKPQKGKKKAGKKGGRKGTRSSGGSSTASVSTIADTGSVRVRCYLLRIYMPGTDRSRSDCRYLLTM